MRYLVFIAFTGYLFNLLGRKSSKNINIYHLENLYQEEYHTLKLINFFPPNSYPEKQEGLHFGFICPGAVKTMEYLNQIEGHRELVEKIRKLTDFQFFLEIISIYSTYLEPKKLDKLRQKIGTSNDICVVSRKITSEITHLFNSLPILIKNNIPDNFYHIRHHTLICSDDQTLVEERIKLIQNRYITEKFTNNISECAGKRDGVSGCRDCCSSKKEYEKCVNNCMKF